MSLTDSRRLYVALRDAGTKGVHSHTIRKMGLSGNPSQRAKDIVSHGVAVWTARENVGRRPGARYWLADHAPDWAVPVRPNGGAEGGDGSSPESRTSRGLPETTGVAAAPLSVTPAPEQVAVKEPVAIVRDWDGEWRELPVSELGWAA